MEIKFFCAKSHEWGGAGCRAMHYTRDNFQALGKLELTSTKLPQLKHIMRDTN